jgi:hypothetical protein
MERTEKPGGGGEAPPEGPLADEEGQAFVEYAILIAFVLVACLVLFVVFPGIVQRYCLKVLWILSMPFP